MSNLSEELKDYVTTTVKLLVDISDDVDVEAVSSTKAIIIQIKVNKSDFGKVIGKKGRTIECLKVLVLAIKNTISVYDKRKILLEILDDGSTSFFGKTIRGGKIKC